MDDAMVVIQEASAAIGKVSQQLNGLEGKHDEITLALKDLSNRISQLESKAPQKKAVTTKAPLYIKVSPLLSSVSKIINNYLFMLTEPCTCCIQGY